MVQMISSARFGPRQAPSPVMVKTELLWSGLNAGSAAPLFSSRWPNPICVVAIGGVSLALWAAIFWLLGCW